MSRGKMKWWAIHKNLPVDVIVRRSHPRSGDSQKQETLLTRSAENPTRNYDIECSNQYPFLSTPSTKALRHSKMKWWAISTNLTVDIIVRLPHPRSGDSQSQETFWAPSAEKKTGNCDIECSKHHPSLSTRRPKGLSRSKMKWWAIYKNLPVDVIVRLPHPRSGDTQGQETFLAPSADKQTRNYDIECSNHHPLLSNVRLKGLSSSKMKWWAISTNWPLDVKVRLPHPRSGDSPKQESFLAPSAQKPTHNYDIESSNQHPSLSTLRPKRLSYSKMKWWAIHTILPVDVIVRLTHPQSGDIQGKKKFLALSADKSTRNCDIDCSNHHPPLSALRPKRLSRRKMKFLSHICKFTGGCHTQTTPSSDSR